MTICFCCDRTMHKGKWFHAFYEVNVSGCSMRIRICFTDSFSCVGDFVHPEQVELKCQYKMLIDRIIDSIIDTAIVANIFNISFLLCAITISKHVLIYFSFPCALGKYLC